MRYNVIKIIQVLLEFSSRRIMFVRFLKLVKILPKSVLGIANVQKKNMNKLKVYNYSNERRWKCIYKIPKDNNL